MRVNSDASIVFSFNKIATSRNVNSTFGTIIIDRNLTFVGSQGLVVSDGNSAARYDEKIPNFAMNRINPNQINQCFGIRNDAQWQTWLLYPNTSNSQVSNENNNILVFNYLDKSWSIYTISLSCLGLFENPMLDPAWISYGTSLADLTWKEFGDSTWISLNQQGGTQLLGGDYQGNVWFMNTGGGDLANNTVFGAPPSPGKAITTQLTTRQWFPYMAEGSAAQFGYVDFLIDADPDTKVDVNLTIENIVQPYISTSFYCVPFENLQFADIANIIQPSNPTLIESQDHGLITGQTIWIFGVQGMNILNNNSYVITVLDANYIILNGIDNTLFPAYTGGGVLSFKPLTEINFWTRVWSGQTGVFHQMQLTTTGLNQTFSLHAMMPWFKKTGRIYK